MPYTITKDFAFSAAHHLEGLEPDHQCARPHGHNYLVRVELDADELDKVGFVFDYGQLGFVGTFLDAWWDHRNLNDHVDFNPTAENLARHLWALVNTVVMRPDGEATVTCTGVGVSETPKTWAWYRP